MSDPTSFDPIFDTIGFCIWLLGYLDSSTMLNTEDCRKVRRRLYATLVESDRPPSAIASRIDLQRRLEAAEARADDAEATVANYVAAGASLPTPQEAAREREIEVAIPLIRDACYATGQAARRSLAFALEALGAPLETLPPLEAPQTPEEAFAEHLRTLDPHFRLASIAALGFCSRCGEDASERSCPCPKDRTLALVEPAPTGPRMWENPDDGL